MNKMERELLTDKYHFSNCEIVRKYGANAALFLERFRLLLISSSLNAGPVDKNRYWTLKSSEELRRIYHYWPIAQTKKVISRLVKKGVILKAKKIKQVNRGSKDSFWYSFSDKMLVDYPDLIVPEQCGYPDEGLDDMGYSPILAEAIKAVGEKYCCTSQEIPVERHVEALICYSVD